MNSETLADMLAEMDAALGEEIEEQARNGQRHTARKGRLVSDLGAIYIYSFTLEELWEPEDDTPLHIKAGSIVMRASVVSAIGATITISTEQALPPTALKQVVLIEDPSLLLERLRDALQASDEGSSHLGSKAFNLTAFRTALLAKSGQYPGFTPNRSQDAAIRWALGSEVMFVIGPPGTGKTSSLGALAYSLVRAGQTVLIAAHTNIAVDNAVLQLAELAQRGKLPELAAGHIIRYGVPQLEQISTRDDIYPPKIAGRIGRELEEERARLTAERARAQADYQEVVAQIGQLKSQVEAVTRSLRTRRSAAAEEHADLETAERRRCAEVDRELAAFAPTLTEAEERHAKARHELTLQVAKQAASEREYTQLDARAEELRLHLDAAQRTNWLVRFVRGLNVEQITQSLADAKQSLWESAQVRAKVMARVHAAHAALSSATQTLTHAQERHIELKMGLQTPEETATRLASLSAEIATCDEEIAACQREHAVEQMALTVKYRGLRAALDALPQALAEIERKLRDIERRLLTDAQVVATTLSKSYMSSHVRERRFDYVIIDEVSMASLPTIYVTASRADKGVILFGDPLQLPPIVHSRAPLARKWLERDLFAVAGITLERAAAGDGKGALLTDQARMHPAISIISRKHVYRGLVVDAQRPYDEAFDRVSPLPGNPLVLCDTSDSQPLACKPGGSSRLNVHHALCALASARGILTTLPATRSDPDNPYRLGIVTPYAKQAKLIHRLIEAHGMHDVVRVGTVHKFQGLQFEAVIFDSVESEPFWPSRQFIGGGAGTTAQRLINVAVTRAQYKLVIIADASHIAKVFQAQDTLLLAVQEAKRAGTISSADLLSALVDAPFAHSFATTGVVTDETAGLSDLRAFEYMSETTFFDRFFNDIQIAKSNVTIFSPFVRDWRVRDGGVIAQLHEARSRGTVVTVITSDAHRDVDRRAKQDLELAGVGFRTITDMHQKLVVIDNSIAYIGSLNALSHRATKEVMIRIECPSFAHQIAQFVGESGQRRRRQDKGTREGSHGRRK